MVGSGVFTLAKVGNLRKGTLPRVKTRSSEEGCERKYIRVWVERKDFGSLTDFHSLHFKRRGRSPRTPIGGGTREGQQNHTKNQRFRVQRFTCACGTVQTDYRDGMGETQTRKPLFP